MIRPYTDALRLTTARTRAVAYRNYAVVRHQRCHLGLYRPRKCNELLNPTRESCLILSQRQPGKFNDYSTIHIALTPKYRAIQCAMFEMPMTARRLSPRVMNPSKNYRIRIDALLSRQPLVKGERLIRYEVNAAITIRCSVRYMLLHAARAIR